jgi:hypothetical protein
MLAKLIAVVRGETFSTSLSAATPLRAKLARLTAVVRGETLSASLSAAIPLRAFGVFAAFGVAAEPLVILRLPSSKLPICLKSVGVLILCVSVMSSLNLGFWSGASISGISGASRGLPLGSFSS